MQDTLAITLKSKIDTLKRNIAQCDKNIAYHQQVISKNLANAGRSSNPQYKANCSRIINARQAAIAENKRRKEIYGKSLSACIRQLSMIH